MDLDSSYGLMGLTSFDEVPPEEQAIAAMK